MTTTIECGTWITIRGTVYRVSDMSEDKGHLGSKFFGKRVFSLTRVFDGVRFTYFGKRPTGNARVRLDKSVYDAHGLRDGIHSRECTRILATQYNGDLMCPCMLANFNPVARVSVIRQTNTHTFDGLGQGHHPDCDQVERDRGSAGKMCDCRAGWHDPNG